MSGKMDKSNNRNHSSAVKEATEPKHSVSEIRERARRHVGNGAVTADYSADIKKVNKMLNESLATELVCVMRYRRHYYMARGVNSEAIAKEFLAHSNEELAHADRLALRIVQLGGEPDLNPDTLTERSHAEYVIGTNLKDMIKEDLVAERIAIESYRGMIEHIGNSDSTTRRLLEDILAVEEEHADELSSLLQ
jgi:bacterioferritin